MTLLQTIQNIVLTYPDHEVRFDQPTEIHFPTGSFECYALQMDTGEGLFLMDGQGEWHGPLQENQVNAGVVIQALYKRLMRIRLKAA